jgi:hypothetical protein
MNTTHCTPLREIVAYLGIAYSLALTIALALPDADINKLLSVMVPTVTVGVLTFTLTPKGSRKSMWRGIGLGRAGLKTWPAAIALPFILCAGAYTRSASTAPDPSKNTTGTCSPRARSSRCEAGAPSWPDCAARRLDGGGPGSDGGFSARSTLDSAAV